HEVHVAEQLDEVVAAALDPEVHRVARHQLRLCDLLQDVELKARVDVAEEHVLRALELRGNLRPEVREHAEARFERLGGVEIVAIAAAPAERFAFGTFESGKVDTARRERVEFLDREVVADDADQLDRGLVTGARGEIHGGAAEDIVGFAEGSFDGIECDRSNYQDGHEKAS